MLQRVSAALSKYLSPIKAVDKPSAANPGGESTPRFERHPSGSQGQKKQGSEAPPQPQKIIKAQQAQETVSEPKASPLAASPEEGPTFRPASAQPGLSVSHAFINLLRTLQSGPGKFQQWLGRGSYRKSLKSQRRSGTVRKGAMLDEKAE
ncbi:MAG: hypothetical protein IT285_15645 [Bdellovibrionales bacterium]|nr:hypothetical protein [Bdellovibrionales bacterium]